MDGDEASSECQHPCTRDRAEPGLSLSPALQRLAAATLGDGEATALAHRSGSLPSPCAAGAVPV